MRHPYNDCIFPKSNYDRLRPSRIRMSRDREIVLSDLPPEVFHEVIFKYITCKDVRSIGKTKNKRLKAIAEDYIQRQICKLDLIIVAYLIDQSKTFAIDLI